MRRRARSLAPVEAVARFVAEKRAATIERLAVPDPVVCGPCGRQLESAAALREHAQSCWDMRAVEADAVRMLSNATVGLMDRLTSPQASAVSYAIHWAARGLTVEQRARLAWLVNEFTDCLPAEAV